MTQDTIRRGSVGTRIKLPWPHKSLSPNARIHWSARARLVKVARGVAKYATMEARGTAVKPDWQRAALTVEFCPPDRRRRDLDNLIASMKATNDGIADAIGVDDAKFTTTYSIGEPVKGGAVLVTVRPI